MSSKIDDFGKLYATEHDRQIARRVGCYHTARDLVQDMFLRLWERATDRPPASPAYLSRSARNAAIDHLRTERRHAEIQSRLLPEQQAGASIPAAEHLAHRQELGLIEAALTALPGLTQDIFLLNRLHGKSFSEIALATGLSRRTVASHIARALQACEAARDAAR